MSEDLSNEKPSRSTPTLTMDWEAYGHFLEESDLSDAEKRELIETMWSIVIGFVDLGFVVRSPDQACGQDAQAGAHRCGDVIDSLVDHWNDATNISGSEPRSPKPRGRTP